MCGDLVYASRAMVVCSLLKKVQKIKVESQNRNEMMTRWDRRKEEKKIRLETLQLEIQGVIK